MADNHTLKQRSYNMSQIRSKNTKPEVHVRLALFAKGFRYRKNDKRLPGKPDIVLPKYKTVIFVNGCFWHMHDCSYFVWPKTRPSFWKEKLLRNAERDRNNYVALEKKGWNVLVVWECQLKKSLFDATITKLIQDITEPAKPLDK